MTGKRGLFVISLALLVLFACTPSSQNVEGMDGTGGEPLDSMENVSEEYDPTAGADEEISEGMDEYFDDFMYAFTSSKVVQLQRVVFPLQIETSANEYRKVERRDWKNEFDFMHGEYYTVLFNSDSQMSLEKETDLQVVQVERISLSDKHIVTYDFERNNGKWILTRGKESTVGQDGLHDFLDFYSCFTTDSVYMAESLAQPLSFSMMDPDEEDSHISGTIDADQWDAFGIELPTGVISNIHYGQTYENPNQMVLQKCAGSGGGYEVFTFEKSDGKWKLVRYEN